MKLFKTGRLFCFSPPVMLAFLAMFQGTEYLLCGGMGIAGGTWSRVGYSSITMLPPLGLHLAYAIAGKKSKYLVPAVYFSAVLFVAYLRLCAALQLCWLLCWSPKWRPKA